MRCLYIFREMTFCPFNEKCHARTQVYVEPMATVCVSARPKESSRFPPPPLYFYDGKQNHAALVHWSSVSTNQPPPPSDFRPTPQSHPPSLRSPFSHATLLPHSPTPNKRPCRMAEKNQHRLKPEWMHRINVQFAFRSCPWFGNKN